MVERIQLECHASVIQVLWGDGTWFKKCGCIVQFGYHIPINFEFVVNCVSKWLLSTTKYIQGAYFLRNQNENQNCICPKGVKQNMHKVDIQISKLSLLFTFPIFHALQQPILMVKMDLLVLKPSLFQNCPVYFNFECTFVINNSLTFPAY